MLAIGPRIRNFDVVQPLSFAAFNRVLCLVLKCPKLYLRWRCLLVILYSAQLMNCNSARHTIFSELQKRPPPRMSLCWLSQHITYSSHYTWLLDLPKSDHHEVMFASKYARAKNSLFQLPSRLFYQTALFLPWQPAQYINKLWTSKKRHISKTLL